MLPSHSQASTLLQRGLFNGLVRFAQLEERLAGLGSTEEQFVAFAVFAEAFLAIRTLPQAADIWPEGSIPLEARRRHALPERIMGADGIFRTLAGDIHPYQLLFRPGRPPLGRKDVTPFLELADRVPQPLLFTNCTVLPPPLRGHNGFHAVLGNDLDRLTSRDFQAMRRWWQGGGFVPDRLPLSLPQSRYVASLQPMLEQQDRVLAVTAPGIGVELLALKWAESVGGGRTVLLVSPSLVHLRETLLLWRRHVVWSDLATLWVGVDGPAGPDATVVRQADWDVPLVGDSEGVRRFLAWRFQGVRVLLATYGSVRVVARALVGLAPLDLGILLESQETLADPFVLDDTNLPLRKRLFLAMATRRANVASRDADGDPRLLWNLADNPRYGPVVPLAPLQQAVADGLLRPWRLLVVVVPPEVDAPTGEEGRMRAVAQALRLVVQQTDARHIQICHGTAQEARAMAGADVHPTDYVSLLLEGSATAAEREALLRQYGQSARALLHHARSLTDGLMPPPADLVLFAPTAKKVKWEVARAMAAILTKPSASPSVTAGHGLSTGLLVVPLMLAPFAREGSVDLLVKDSLAAADGLWEVVQVLRELEHILDEQIGLLGEYRGRTGLWPDRSGDGPGRYLAERLQFVLPPALPAEWSELIWHHFLKQLGSNWDRQFGQWQRPDREQDALLVEWVEQQRRAYRKGGLRPDRVRRLTQAGFVWDPKKAAWDALFAELLRYRQRHGHTQVPDHWPENPALADWIQQQRRDHLKGRLDAEEVARLTEAGFVWNPEQVAWDEMFRVFQAFQQHHGHGLIPEQWPGHPGLAEWARQQRLALAKGVLAAGRSEALDALGFCWDLDQARWEEQFATFLQFKQSHGHGLVPEIWPDNPSLAFWAKEQRKERARGKLSVERQVLLDELGFCWDLEAAYWEEQWAALRRFQAEQGHCLVPSGWPVDPLLADWVVKQRRDWRAGRLAAERMTRLDELGFVWDPEEQAWQDQWTALVAFHGVHGHCHVGDDQPQLAEWVRQQRRAGWQQTLSGERRARLDTLAFVWDAQEAEWDAMVVALRRFRAERSHCIIPTQFPDNPALARWVGAVRRARAAGSLPADKVQQLDGLGFVWDAKAILWEEMFAALAEFRRQYGNCLVPESYPDNNQLAWWVVAQRKAYKTGQLEPERVERLNALGFFWDPLEVQWYEMFLALVHYREQFGHCLVTRGTGDPRLFSWVATQRQARLHGHLSPVRIERLNSLGFVWDQKEVVLEEMLLELAAFKQAHGHCNVPVPWPKNPALGLWVQFQRQEYKKEHLDPKRIQRLEALGFVWE
ncbi:MAG: Helicase associated domain protein [Magnetococcus sp. DMHC-8]